MPASIKHLTDKKLNLNSLLARWQDGLYYTAAIVKCDKANKKCLVCFEDGSEVWVKNRDVHIQLTLDQLNEDEDIVCCICDDGNSEAPNEIILCDVCQQGYHQKCHNPPVDSSKIDESEDNSDHKDWFCATCSYILNQSNRAKLSSAAQQPQQSKQAQQQSPTTTTTTPKQKQKQPPPQLKSPQPVPSQPRIQPQPRQTVTKSTKQTAAPHPPQQKQQQQQQKQPQSQSQPTNPQQPPQSPQPTNPQPQPPPQSQSHQHQQQQQQQQQTNQRTSVGPVKSTVSQVQKQAPYYPLSSHVRAVATSSTAASASMTASSALVVGGTAGRTKQDLVNQGSRGPQRQQRQPIATSFEPISTPVKHAVRKSSMNFVLPPVRQSALPTATRSVVPTSIETIPNPVTKVNQNPGPNPTVIVTTSVPIIPTTAIPSLSSQAYKINPASKSNESKSQKPSKAPGASKLTTWTVDPHLATLPLIHPALKLSPSIHEGTKTPSAASSNFTTLITNTGGKSFSAGTESGNGIVNSSAPPADTTNRNNMNSNSNYKPDDHQ